MVYEMIMINIAPAAMTLNQQSDSIKLLTYLMYCRGHNLVSSITPELVCEPSTEY
jgi:hypothetical protein